MTKKPAISKTRLGSFWGKNLLATVFSCLSSPVFSQYHLIGLRFENEDKDLAKKEVEAGGDDDEARGPE